MIADQAPVTDLRLRPSDITVVAAMDFELGHCQCAALADASMGYRRAATVRTISPHQTPNDPLEPGSEAPSRQPTRCI